MSGVTRKLSPAEIDATASEWILRREAGLEGTADRALSDWLAADARHAESFARHEQAWVLLNRPRAAGRAQEMAGALEGRAKRRLRRRLNITASLALMLLVAGIIWRAQPVATPTLATASSSAVVLLPQKRTLPDGSIVELKAGAEITIEYTARRRGVTLRRGEALFQVTSDASRPFVVTAAGIAVRAVGTEFLVQLGAAAVDVVVTEGQIAVEHEETEMPGIAADTGNSSNKSGSSSEFRPPLKALVDAGNRVTVDLATKTSLPQPIAITPAEVADRLAWRAPRLEFADVPLAEAIALINRHSSVRLIVDDAVLAKTPVNGIFRADNTDALIHLLEESFGVKAKRTGDTVTLRRATTP
jgi:transmembrane sensor